ncbi:MAG TPA: SDR family NAD(P)-dependent oxidoreductase [Candidatus Polarisedimenticolaceae bacterium]|nr:SDR family NAD(P)-dependent oxidoreductase [Candidatus Polarisedimenticolaceae bacterium]
MARAFAGKTVLITGASSGIGKAAASAFAAQGAQVIAIARDREKLDALAAGNSSIVPLVCDVTDGPAMETLARTVLERFGAPDVVVANAGRGVDAPFVATSDDAYRALFEVNVLGVVRTIRPFLPAMIARGSGRVLIVSSIVGKRGVPNYSAYAASKFALHGILDALRPELSGTGVSAGIVCPSSTETEFDSRKLRAGTPQNKVRVQRHSAESVARALVRMARWTRREMVISPEGKLMVVVDRLAPSLMDWILARTLVKR